MRLFFIPVEAEIYSEPLTIIASSDNVIYIYINIYLKENTYGDVSQIWIFWGALRKLSENYFQDRKDNVKIK